MSPERKGRSLRSDYTQIMYFLEGECQKVLEAPIESAETATGIVEHLIELTQPFIGVISRYEQTEAYADDVVMSLLLAATIPSFTTKGHESVDTSAQDRSAALVSLLRFIAPHLDVDAYIAAWQSENA